MNIERTAAPPAPLPALTALDLTNMQFGMAPATLEMIGHIFLKSAARLRAHGHTGGEGRA